MQILESRVTKTSQVLVCTNDRQESMFVEVTFTETGGMKAPKCLIEVRATLASKAIETS